MGIPVVPGPALARILERVGWRSALLAEPGLEVLDDLLFTQHGFSLGVGGSGTLTDLTTPRPSASGPDDADHHQHE